MATQTDNYNFIKPDIHSTNWGTLLNHNFDQIDQQLSLLSRKIEETQRNMGLETPPYFTYATKDNINYPYIESISNQQILAYDTPQKQNSMTFSFKSLSINTLFIVLENSEIPLTTGSAIGGDMILTQGEGTSLVPSYFIRLPQALSASFQPDKINGNPNGTFTLTFKPILNRPYPEEVTLDGTLQTALQTSIINLNKDQTQTNITLGTTQKGIMSLRFFYEHPDKSQETVIIDYTIIQNGKTYTIKHPPIPDNNYKVEYAYTTIFI